MGDFSFKPTSSIFKKREALLEDWTPNTLVGRDRELNRYHAALQPVIENEPPSNIFLYGKSGVGKTAATRFLLEQLQADAESDDELSLTTIELNCDRLNTSYQAAVALVNSIRDSGNHISNTGYPEASVYDFLFQDLDDIGGTILIVLDEVDHLQNDTLLYQLPRARSNGDITNARLGVIGISNDLSYRDELSRKVRSSLCEKEVSFSTYDAKELVKVLEQRKSVAFKQGVVGEGVIQLCAAYGAKDSGDARQALDLLLESGDLAREKTCDKVTESHVKEARERLQSEQVVEGLRNFSWHGKLALWTLMMLEKDKEGPVRTRDVYELYRMQCKKEGDDPVSNRAVRDYLSDLETLGILSSNEVNRGLDGGAFKTYTLKQPESDVKAGLTEFISPTD